VRSGGAARGWLLLALALGCEPEVSALEMSLYELRARGLPIDSADCGGAPAERIGMAPALIDRHYPTTARRPVPAAMVRDLRQAIGALPAPVARAFERHVCRVVLVTGLRVAGTLSMLRDEPSRGVIVLNLDYLGQSADAWMSAKEASFFEAEPGLSIVAHMAAESDRAALLEFLLTHELGHVLHSVFFDDPTLQRVLDISWPRRDNLIGSPLFAYALLRDESPLGAHLVEPFYEMLAASSFPSLTAAGHRNEDFADSFSSYAHSVLSGRPWAVEVYRGDARTVSFDSCWDEARCSDKRAALEEFLSRF
jgi:hypothetical protein